VPWVFVRLLKGIKMIVGLDFDNTLVKSVVSYVKIAAEKTGVKDYPPCHDYWFTDYPEKMREEIFKLFKDPKYMQAMEPLPGAIKRLELWKRDGHKLIIITARDILVKEASLKCINDLFPMIDEVFFVPIGTSKEELFKDLKIDVWIDDSPFDVPTAVRLGIKTYFISNIDTFYNWEVADSKIAPVYDSVANINFI